MSTTGLSPLQQTVAMGGNDYWNDSCSVQELNYAIANGAVGATTNPTIVLGVLKKELAVWREPLERIIDGNPTWTEEEVAWRLIEEMALKAAEVLKPIFDRENGRKGRISMQTNPTFYRNTEAIVAQATHFHGLAPNIQVKIPVTRAGIPAIEEATYRGVNVNATVCFTLPQAIAVAEAVDRGLNRRTAAGLEIANMTPVCTLMIGRLDDWLKVAAKKAPIVLTPGHLDWAGIAVMKKAYALFQERGYRARLLAAAYRHHLHWSELIGGDIIQTIPYEWQLLFNHSDIEVRKRMQNPVDLAIVEELYRKCSDFRRAYDEGGMAVEEFDRFGATVRTLRTFIGSYSELLACVRDFMLPDPDK
ncbi:MAG TPA: transaldolase family protein [Candidatus Paceibacterota bacterium]|nr:transaldolase family protein [Verrucomicrobiota bacterium]HRY51095.1 transaldolase family protein [Candidatus Paceibacterota bacterium]HSA01360.1 transaldolase family protein [Candidatus Paceibacterota bacterium]